jgi:hypothetical protein
MHNMTLNYNGKQQVWKEFPLEECTSNTQRYYYLPMVEEIGQFICGHWDADAYRAWRFPLGEGSEAILEEPNRSAVDAKHDVIQTCMIQVQQPFLECYRNVYGPVGLYWIQVWYP